MKRSLIGITFGLGVALLVAACGGAEPTATPQPTATPAPTAVPPTPTPSFELRRSDVVRFLKAYNTIVNDFTAASQSIGFPSSISTSDELLAYNNALTKLATLADATRQRIAGLQPSALESETTTHSQQSLTLLDDLMQTLASLKAAIANGDQGALQQQRLRLATVAQGGASLDQHTEALMLKYSIPDTEVGYRPSTASFVSPTPTAAPQVAFTLASTGPVPAELLPDQVAPNSVAYGIRVTGMDIGAVIAQIGVDKFGLSLERPQYSSWGRTSKDFSLLIIYVRTGTPSGTYRVSLRLPDGRTATTTFDHLA